jgi:hypothetical protein
VTGTPTATPTPTNPALVVRTSGGSLIHTANQAATAIDPGVIVADPISATFVSASVQITTGCESTQDVLGFNTTGTAITGTLLPASCQLALTGRDTLANYQQVLRSVTYLNTSATPSTVPCVVTFKANDGTGASGSATRGISVLP